MKKACSCSVVKMTITMESFINCKNDEIVKDEDEDEDLELYIGDLSGYNDDDDEASDEGDTKGSNSESKSPPNLQGLEHQV